MLLGKVLKNINKKYKSINFKNIRLNSKECKKGDIFDNFVKGLFKLS